MIRLLSSALLCLTCIYVLAGCSAFGVLASSDPNVKLNQAYSLLEAGRAIPAKKLFLEVIAIAQDKKDWNLEVNGLTGLATVYSTHTYGALKENLTDYQLASSTHNDIATKFIENGYPKRAAISYFNAAVFSQDTAKACEYYKKSKAIHQMKSTHSDDVDTFPEDADKEPFLKQLKSLQKKYRCK